MSAAEITQGPHKERAPIWTRRPREPAGAYAAFVVYRDQTPPRSLAKCAKALERGTRVIAGWSSKWDWVERATAWTDHLDALAIAQTEEDVVRRRREESERLFKIGRDLQDVGTARLHGVKDGDALIVAPLDPNTLDADDVARLLDLGTKFTRVAMGLPTDVTGNILISMPDFQKILGSFFAIAEKHMSREEHDALIRECYAMIREMLGQ